MFPYNSQGHFGPQRKPEAILHSRENAADTRQKFSAAAAVLTASSIFLSSSPSLALYHRSPLVRLLVAKCTDPDLEARAGASLASQSTAAKIWTDSACPRAKSRSRRK